MDHAHRALVDKQLKRATWVGAVPASHTARLPAPIEQVDLFTCGPVQRSWLVNTLGQLTQLRNLHIAAEDLWEPAPLKEAKRSAKPEEVPGALAALPDLLALACPAPNAPTPSPAPSPALPAMPPSPPHTSSSASPAPAEASEQQVDAQERREQEQPHLVGHHLTSLTLMGVGCSLRRVRDRDMRLMMARLRELPAGAGHGLLRFAAPFGLNHYRSFLQVAGWGCDSAPLGDLARDPPCAVHVARPGVSIPVTRTPPCRAWRPSWSTCAACTSSAGAGTCAVTMPRTSCRGCGR